MSIHVAILGATGVVGQKAIALLSSNPNFEIIELVASNERIGKAYREVCDWREPLIRLSDFENLKAEFIISCLPAEIAEKIEPMLAVQGKIVFSNASRFRMEDNIPLLVPEINSQHLSLLKSQTTKGKIITNPNCSAVGISLALAPLMRIGEIDHVSSITMQSVSGAGYPGVSSLDILGNTIPHIEGEAEKITEETKKILGSTNKAASFAVTTHVHRVPVIYGHTATLHISFKQEVDLNLAIKSYKDWNLLGEEELFILHANLSRPQAIKDLLHDDMRVHISNIRIGDKKNILGLVVLSHNLVRGAAGAVIANMESYLSFQEGI